MKVSVLCTILSLALAISAYPAGKAANPNPNGCGTGLSVSKGCSTTVVDKYDDIPANPALPEANMISIYNGKRYEGFNVSNKTNPLTGTSTGCQPRSSPNVIATKPPTNGTAGTAYITTQYSGSPYSSFTPLYFSSGCNVRTVEGQVSLAVKCNITVNGYRNGVLVASQMFYLTPLSATSTPLQQFSFTSRFAQVTNVTYTTDSPDIKVGFVDDFGNILYT